MQDRVNNFLSLLFIISIKYENKKTVFASNLYLLASKVVTLYSNNACKTMLFKNYNIII